MAIQKSKRRRLDRGRIFEPATVPANNSRPATERDCNKWGAFFNVMLRQMGVEGVKVREVISLDADIMQDLPRPVYGFVFLFKWREDEFDDPKDDETDYIWFANQTVNNACATIALLNILFNIPEVRLGEHLAQFKEFTKNLPPALRGDAIGNFEFVKQIHNSFARRMDILNSDLQMKNEAMASNRKSSKRNAYELEANFHFNAFVPIEGKLFKLDGLESKPKYLGTVEEGDWLGLVTSDLEARMAAYGDRMEFAVLGLVKDPLEDLRSALAENTRGIRLLDNEPEANDNDWQVLKATEHEIQIPHQNSSNALLSMPEAPSHIPEHRIESAQNETRGERTFDKMGLESFPASRKELIQVQEALRQRIKAEELSDQLDEEKSSSRRHDFGPVVEAWLRIHSRKGLVKDILSSNYD